MPKLTKSRTKPRTAFRRHAAPDALSWLSAQPWFVRWKTPRCGPQNWVHPILSLQVKRMHSFLLFPDFDFVSWMVYSQTFICRVPRCWRWSAHLPAESTSWRPTNTRSTRATASTARDTACWFVSAWEGAFGDWR